MKKSLTFVSAALLLLFCFSFMSCEKCTTCKYTYVVLNETRTYEYPEVCGDNEDIDNLEQLCDDESALVNGDCSCN